MLKYFNIRNRYYQITCTQTILWCLTNVCCYIWGIRECVFIYTIQRLFSIILFISKEEGRKETSNVQHIIYISGSLYVNWIAHNLIKIIDFLNVHGMFWDCSLPNCILSKEKKGCHSCHSKQCLISLTAKSIYSRVEILCGS